MQIERKGVKLQLYGLLRGCCLDKDILSVFVVIAKSPKVADYILLDTCSSTGLLKSSVVLCFKIFSSLILGDNKNCCRLRTFSDNYEYVLEMSKKEFFKQLVAALHNGAKNNIRVLSVEKDNDFLQRTIKSLLVINHLWKTVYTILQKVLSSQVLLL